MAKRKRFKSVLKLRNELLSVVLSDSHRSRGRVISGYRVVRVVQAIWDRKLMTIVKIVARCYSGESTKFDGWTGPRVVLTERREWHGQTSMGVVRGKEHVPVDTYVKALYRKDAKPKEAPPVDTKRAPRRPPPADTPETATRKPPPDPTPEPEEDFGDEFDDEYFGV